MSDAQTEVAAPACFRHPDRSTLRQCTRCDRFACPACLIDGAVGSQCVECVRGAEVAYTTANKAADKAHGRNLAAVVRPSPVFLGLVALFIASAVWSWRVKSGENQAAALAFMITGWCVSLTLHEFGHAVTAYSGGDRTVADKGYLTLDLRKYVHPFLSIVLPLLFMLAGGIGLPGGAVWIRNDLIRKPARRSLVSAAGPLANVLFAVACLLPIRLFAVRDPRNTFEPHSHFFAVLGFLGLLQITAVLINLLPIPGLDGFGILEPWLPPGLRGAVAQIRQYGFFILYLLLWQDTPVSRGVFSLTRQIFQAFGIWRGWPSLGRSYIPSFG
jgi:Zn-dependent protease